MTRKEYGLVASSEYIFESVFFSMFTRAHGPLTGVPFSLITKEEGPLTGTIFSLPMGERGPLTGVSFSTLRGRRPTNGRLCLFVCETAVPADNELSLPFSLGQCRRSERDTRSNYQLYGYNLPRPCFWRACDLSRIGPQTMKPYDSSEIMSIMKKSH